MPITLDMGGFKMQELTATPMSKDISGCEDNQLLAEARLTASSRLHAAVSLK
jgi:hypothetical protein